MPRITHPRTVERTRPPRRGRLRLLRGGGEVSAPAPTSASTPGPAATRAAATPTATDLWHARSAGGPEDNAAYTCSCGCFFSAQVSTTVRCPHCGATQAW